MDVSYPDTFEGGKYATNLGFMKIKFPATTGWVFELMVASYLGHMRKNEKCARPLWWDDDVSAVNMSLNFIFFADLLDNSVSVGYNSDWEIWVKTKWQGGGSVVLLYWRQALELRLLRRYLPRGVL